MKSDPSVEFQLSCPLPVQNYPKILLGHGGGGALTHQLIQNIFLPAFQSETLKVLHDGATLSVEGGKWAMTTDSFVVKPLVFAGGDIGKLAVCGTVNDLAMCGAQPLYMSVGWILEEGLETALLWQIVQSMKKTAEEAGIEIVTADTKVVERGKGDGVFINTTGIGRIISKNEMIPKNIQTGDALLISGDVGRHGIAVMSEREGLQFKTQIHSDCAPLNHITQALLNQGLRVRCMRDLTRGGLATALLEMSEQSGLEFSVNEAQIPVSEPVRGACEILGLEPIYVANEGCFVLMIHPEDAQKALEILKSFTTGQKAALIGTVGALATKGRVLLKTSLGAERTLDRLAGEQLPRIC